MDKIILKAFRAPKEPQLCSDFLHEHRMVLADFGIPQTVLPDESWTRDPNCHVIVAMHETLGMVGGIRLQLDQPDKPLPLQHTIEGLDPRIVKELAALAPMGNAEVCGLWNANRYANRGIPILLSVAVTAIATQAQARTMVCFVAHYTKRHPSRNGFITMGSVGSNGSFDYPIAGIKSIVMVNPDTLLLPHAAPDQRQLIFSLRVRPDQRRFVNLTGTDMLVDFALLMDDHIYDMVAYRSIVEEYLSHTG